MSGGIQPFLLFDRPLSRKRSLMNRFCGMHRFLRGIEYWRGVATEIRLVWSNRHLVDLIGVP